VRSAEPFLLEPRHVAANHRVAGVLDRHRAVAAFVEDVTHAGRNALVQRDALKDADRHAEIHQVLIVAGCVVSLLVVVVDGKLGRERPSKGGLQRHTVHAAAHVGHRRAIGLVRADRVLPHSVVLEDAHEFVILVDTRGQLDERLMGVQQVRREIAGEIGCERLEGSNVGGRAVHGGIDVGPAIGAEDPGLVALNRPAKRRVELVDFPGARRADNTLLPVLSGVVPVP
jgi:hypothetical protein